jgi:flagellar biosynthesis protein FlhB
MIVKSIKFFVVVFVFFVVVYQIASVSQNTVLVSGSGNFETVRLDAANNGCKSSFFGLEPWFEFLKTYHGKNNNCNVCFTVISNSAQSVNSNCRPKQNSIVLVVMAIIDDLLRVAGLVSVAFIVVAGFQYVTSQGNPEKAAKAQQTILFALIGLVIAISAIVLVTYIGNSLAK